MSDPIRLVDATSSPALAAVLRSASSDVPENADRERRRIIAAAALATGAGALATHASWLRRGAWLLLGATVTTLSASWVVSSRRDLEPVSARLPHTVESSHVTMAPVPSTVVSMRVDELPTATPPPVANIAAGSSAAPAPAAVPDELTMIDAVRSALAAGQPNEAIERLAAYRRYYWVGALSTEADVLEVQALAALGRTDEARAKGQKFLDTHPGSPYEKRVRASAQL